MQCLFHATHDDQESCLLGGKQTSCGFFRCFQTVGKACSFGHEMKLNGKECGKTLVCGEFRKKTELQLKKRLQNALTGCDKKCNGCMNVNGVSKCHFADCLPFGKRNQMKTFPQAQLETHDRSIEYPTDDTTAV